MLFKHIITFPTGFHMQIKLISRPQKHTHNPNYLPNLLMEHSFLLFACCFFWTYLHLWRPARAAARQGTWGVRDGLGFRAAAELRPPGDGPLWVAAKRRHVHEFWEIFTSKKSAALMMQSPHSIMNCTLSPCIKSALRCLLWFGTV